MSERRCENWLKSLLEMTERTEAPPEFWLWSGVYTLGSVLQRKVYVPPPTSLSNIYANHYIVLVAPPGRCRKGGPIKLAKDLLKELDIKVGVDSTTKQALTMELAESRRYVSSGKGGEPVVQSALSVISSELSSLLIDPKPMIEVLTDLYDCHDKWEYKTKRSGEDNIINSFVSLFAATTPGWLSNNLPQESIGGGFTSRTLLVVATDRVKSYAFPEIREDIYSDLVHDLNLISRLGGEFSWTKEATDYYTSWYEKRKPKYYRVVSDERFDSFFERIHLVVVKTAMCLKVAKDSELVLGVDEIGQAIDLMEAAIPKFSSAFGGLGSNAYGNSLYKLMQLLQKRKKMSATEIRRLFWRDLGHMQMEQMLQQIIYMDRVRVYQTGGGVIYEWKD